MIFSVRRENAWEETAALDAKLIFVGRVPKIENH